MRTADGYPVVCYGSYYKGHKTAHRICKQCGIYQTSKTNTIKPTYRMEGIHKTGSRTCPIYEPKNTRLCKEQTS